MQNQLQMQQKTKNNVLHGVQRAVTQPTPGLTTGSVLPVQAKYRLAELIRAKFGELGVEDGITALAAFCGLKSLRTVREWLYIPAGADTEISHIVAGLVMRYFDLNQPEQLLTEAHKQLLKAAAAVA